jgi:hypothetical protein
MGEVEPGHAADLVLWGADPSDPTSGAAVLADPGTYVRLVVKGGLLAAAPGGPGAHAFAAVNARLAGGGGASALDGVRTGAS